MKWFEGDISEAISLSKQRNAVFVVFVYGNDEVSNATLAAIEAPEVSNKLSSNDFVAVKLESGSQPYHQFVQIYQLVPVPSLFFIGQSGVPLDVVPGQATSAMLLEHIDNLTGGSSQTSDAPVKEAIPAPTPTPTAQPVRQEPAASLAQPVRQEPAASLAQPVRQEPAASIAQPAAVARETTPTTPDPQEETLEQRIKRAEQARAAVAAKKQREEEELEREREQTRRREGQELLQAKRDRDALEAQLALEERKREREQERSARERVLQQIAQDKLERASRLAAEKGASPPPPTPSASSSTARVTPAPITAARLQFRLPNGSSHTHIFEPQTSLGEVRQYVRSTLHPANFSLSMAFPRAELASEDDNRSLQDIGLVPSAALLVLPQSSSVSGVPAAAGTGLMAMLWMLLTPFTVLWSLVSSRIWGDPGNPPPPTQAGPGPAGAAAQARASQANQGEVRHRVRQEGNIHRLTGSQDSDDENNTYNGNSTQQM